MNESFYEVIGEVICIIFKILFFFVKVILILWLCLKVIYIKDKIKDISLMLESQQQLGERHE